MRLQSAVTEAPIACPGMFLRGAAVRPKPAADSLIQIRRSYRARWQELDLSVDLDSNQWTARIQDRARSQTIHTAHRSSATAARIAAAEFALFCTNGIIGAEKPETLANSLEWRECWQ